MNKRNAALDLLKIVLSLLVILLHCNFYKEYNKTISSLIVNGLARIAVPVFFIINGYFFKTLIDNNRTKSWFKKVLMIYIVWMVIYSFFWFNNNLINLIFNLFIGYHHLWYISAMVASAFIFLLIKPLNSKTLLMIALILFITGTTIQYLGNFHVFSTKKIDLLFNTIFLYRNFIFLGLPFFIIGYLVNNNNWEILLSKNQTKYFALLGFFILLIESYLNFYFTNEGMDMLFSLIFICPLIFIYFRDLDLNFKSEKNAQMATAIYLTHPLIISLLNHFYKFTPTFLSFFTILISVVFAYFLVKLNSKIKCLF